MGLRPQELRLVVPPESFVLERVRLRRPRVSDAAAVFEYASDPEVTRYAEWPMSTTVDSVRERLSGRAEQWQAGVEFHWAVAVPDDRVIGAVACRVAEHSAEYGFVLNRLFWGNGYATEVSRAIVEWVFQVPSIWRLSATCDTQNLASARVLEKSGLSREGVLRRSIVRPNLSAIPRDAFLYSRVRE